MNKIFLLALPEELPDVPSYCDDQVFFTGVGKTNAAIVASDLIKTYNPNLVVNLGTAGSFDKNLSGLHKCGTFINRDCHPEFHETIRYGTGLTLSTGDSFALQEKDSNVVSTSDMGDFVINELEKLKQIVKKNNLEDNVEFTGWIKREEIPERISDASIGIGPLRLTDVTSGALPIKVLEYMAASLPIIAQKGTLQHDVLKNEKNGYFVENQEDLSEKIILLLTNPEKIREMGEVSNQMVQKFSWDSVVSSILEISQKTKNDFG